MNRVERLKEKKAAKSHDRKVLLKRGLLISSVALIAVVVAVMMCYFFFIRDSAKPAGEPGESAEVPTQEIAEPPPVIPEGVQTWRQVADKMAADSAYNSLVGELTGLDLAAVDALAVLEERGMVLRTSLPAGTFLINSGSGADGGYFSFDQYLPQDREALTDTSGKPQVLTHCGNPMKLVPPSEQPSPQPEEPEGPAPDVPPEEEPEEPPPPPPPPGPVPCPPEPPPAVEPPPPPPPPGPVPCPTPGEEEPAPEIPPDQDPEPPSGEEEPGGPADDAPVT